MRGPFFWGVMLCVLFGHAVFAIEPERLFYLSNGDVILGLVYKPQGKGPFPGVIYSQSTPKDWATDSTVKPPFQALAQFYTGKGFALFLPGRRKWQTPEQEAESSNDPEERDRVMMRSNQKQAEVVFSAIETLKAQSFIDASQIYVTGHGSGGSTSLLMAEKHLDVRGYVVFSPGAATWQKSPLLQTTLKNAVKNATAPVFLIQIENDATTLPAQILGKELEQKGRPNRVKIYPPFGRNATEATTFSMVATQIWGDDVLQFFRELRK